MRSSKLAILRERAILYAKADDTKAKADEVMRLALHVAVLLEPKLRRKFWRRIGDAANEERLKLIVNPALLADRNRRLQNQA